MNNYLFRCSSIAKLMTEPKTKSEGVLSVGAKTYLRELAAQEIFGVKFSVSSKPMTKGILQEQAGIDLLNEVRGLNLVKNTERRNTDLLTGECDLFDKDNNRGHDIKCSWSLATFPAFVEDAISKDYEWQMRGYMMLWDAEEWEVNYCMVDTPDELCQYEDFDLHVVSHLPPHHRLTTWLIKRDKEKEEKIIEKLTAAQEQLKKYIIEFDETHREIKK